MFLQTTTTSPISPMRKASIHRLKDKYKSQLTRGRQPTEPPARTVEASTSGPSVSTNRPSTSTRGNIPRASSNNPKGGASDYYSKFKNRNRLASSDENTDKVSSTAATTTTFSTTSTSKAEREMMHISPSSNFQNLGDPIGDDYDDDDDDDYEESDELIESKSEIVPSTTSRSTTTQPPSTTTTATTTPVTTTTTTTTTSTTTASEEDYEEDDEEEPKLASNSGAPFFPTRMTAATAAGGVEKSSTASISPTKPATVATTSEDVSAGSADPTPDLKDLLRSGKHGNDPAKIKEMLKNFNKASDEEGDSNSDQDDLNPKEIFKKYANLAKSKPTEVSVLGAR